MVVKHITDAVFALPTNTISNAPKFIGQTAVVGTNVYVATGTSSTSNWTLVNNSGSNEIGITTTLDNFDRANSTTTLGASWIADTGVWGISSNKAYTVSANSGDKVYRDVAASDYTFTSTTNSCLTDSSNVALAELIFRLIDASNYLVTYIYNGNLNLSKVVAGTETILTSASFAGVTNTNYNIKIVTAGNSIKISIDNVEKISYTLNGSDATTFIGTKVGFKYETFGTAATPARWDNFSIQSGTINPTILEINVKLLGAAGDGVTDDTNIIQKALDLAGIGAGVVRIPAGSYLISSTLNVPLGVSIKGAGGAFTEIKTSSAIKMINVATLNNDNYGNRYGTLSDFYLNGNNIATMGIDYSYVVVERNITKVVIKNVKGIGLRMDASQNNEFIGLSIEYCDTGMSILNGAGNNAFYRCEFNSCSVVSVLLDVDNTLYGYDHNDFSNTTQANLWSKCIMERGTAPYAIKINNGLRNTFEDCDIQAGSTNKVYLSANAILNVFNRCSFLSNANEVCINNLGYRNRIINNMVEGYSEAIMSAGNGEWLWVSNETQIEGTHLDPRLKIVNKAGSQAYNIRFKPLNNVGTTSERPSSGNLGVGTAYWDLDLSKPVWYDGVSWTTYPSASGGITTAASLPTATPGLKGSLYLINGTSAVAEISTVTFTSGATASGNIQIFLDGIGYVVSVLNTDNTASLVAAKVRAASFNGWTVTGSGANAIFTSNTAVSRGDTWYSAGTTGATATVNTNTQGVNGTPDILYICIRLANGTYDWKPLF